MYFITIHVFYFLDFAAIMFGMISSYWEQNKVFFEDEAASLERIDCPNKKIIKHIKNELLKAINAIYIINIDIRRVICDITCAQKKITFLCIHDDNLGIWGTIDFNPNSFKGPLCRLWPPEFPSFTPSVQQVPVTIFHSPPCFFSPR